MNFDHLHNDLELQLKRLGARQPIFEQALLRYGRPDPHLRRPGFAALAQIVVAQQVSTVSARAVWNRLVAAAGGPLTPQGFIDLGHEGWRQAGLTRPKQGYIKALAEAILEGSFDSAQLETLDDDAARAALIARPGFGRWSAEIYLLMALRRPDIFPAGDLAVRLGYRDLAGAAETASEKDLRLIAEPWSPYRSCAALMLWHVYLANRAKDAPLPG